MKIKDMICSTNTTKSQFYDKTNKEQISDKSNQGEQKGKKNAKYMK